MLISIVSCSEYDRHSGTVHGLHVTHGPRFCIAVELRPQLPDAYLLELLDPITGHALHSGTPVAFPIHEDYNVLAWPMNYSGPPATVLARVEAAEQGVLGARLIKVGHGKR